MYLKQKKSNFFSGIIGFSNANQKFRIVGQADVRLYNLFKNADLILLKWQNTKTKSQNLTFDVNFPYIFNTALGVSNLLIIKKIDTSYVNFSNNFQLNYYASGLNKAGLFTEYKRSIVVDTNSVFQDFTTKVYGLDFHWQNLDNPVNPQKGYWLDFNVGVGKKDYFDTTSRQIIFNADLQFFVPLGDDFTVFLHQFAYFIGSNADLQENELFFFGGSALMRGFNEEELTASALNLNTLEIRYLLDNSNFFVFADYSIFQHKTFVYDYFNHPLGIGLGVNLQVNSGNLSISFALGRDDNTDFRLNNSKLHIGYKSYF